jgi:chemotaxis receptor (MCP) glutamine deamidase CheD
VVVSKQTASCSWSLVDHDAPTGTTKQIVGEHSNGGSVAELARYAADAKITMAKMLLAAGDEMLQQAAKVRGGASFG